MLAFTIFWSDNDKRKREKKKKEGEKKFNKNMAILTLPYMCYIEHPAKRPSFLLPLSPNPQGTFTHPYHGLLRFPHKSPNPTPTPPYPTPPHPIPLHYTALTHRVSLAPPGSPSSASRVPLGPVCVVRPSPASAASGPQRQRPRSACRSCCTRRACSQIPHALGAVKAVRVQSVVGGPGYISFFFF